MKTMHLLAALALSAAVSAQSPLESTFAGGLIVSNPPQPGVSQYFDVNENLYLSNNSNGYIYRVTLNGALSEAVFFTYGPSSNSNDGARCALAEIEISDLLRFS